MECYLITQNIDDFHSRLIKSSKHISPSLLKPKDKGFGFTDGVIEIHGNLSYMRCFAECSLDLIPVPNLTKE